MRLGIGTGIPFERRVSGAAVVRLPAPAGLSVTPNDEAGTIDASWDPVVGATGYEYNYGPSWVDIGNTTSITALSLSYGSYTLRVRGYDANAGRSASESFELVNPETPVSGWGWNSGENILWNSSEPITLNA